MGATGLTGDWNYPTAMRFGAGRISELPAACRELGMERPLLVTDAGLARLPIATDAVASCRADGVDVRVFSDVKSNPTGANVEAGLAVFRDGGHDGVIAFGGGSGIDVAKAVALMANQTCALWDLEDAGDNWTRANAEDIVPIVAVPTTAGTGSEVGRASVITDEARHVKRIIFHPKMLPGIVIADPRLTFGLPPHLTAATGMDALSHNLEAFCATGYHPMARGIAIEGIRLVKEWLPNAFKNGGDVTARSNMLAASSMGATAFQRGLGAIHALAHPLGALQDAHHGLLNAILMPYVLAANRHAIADELSHLERCLGFPASRGERLLDWLLSLRSELSIPHCLADIGIDAQNAGEIGRLAERDPSAGANPIRFDANDYAEIFTNAVKGRL